MRLRAREETKLKDLIERESQGHKILEISKNSLWFMF